MTKVLVTGAAGNIGSSLVKHLINKSNYFVVGVDNLSTGNISNLPFNNNSFVFQNVDVNNFDDITKIFNIYQFDYVFHFAAMVGVKRTLENPLSVLKDIDGIRNILNLSKDKLVSESILSKLNL